MTNAQQIGERSIFRKLDQHGPTQAAFLDTACAVIHARQQWRPCCILMIKGSFSTS
jgi:hypothetical protein